MDKHTVSLGDQSQQEGRKRRAQVLMLALCRLFVEETDRCALTECFIQRAPLEQLKAGGLALDPGFHPSTITKW